MSDEELQDLREEHLRTEGGIRILGLVVSRLLQEHGECYLRMDAAGIEVVDPDELRNTDRIFQLLDLLAPDQAVSQLLAWGATDASAIEYLKGRDERTTARRTVDSGDNGQPRRG